MLIELVASATCLAISALFVDLAWRQFEGDLLTSGIFSIHAWILTAAGTYGLAVAGILHLRQALTTIRSQTS